MIGDDDLFVDTFNLKHSEIEAEKEFVNKNSIPIQKVEAEKEDVKTEHQKSKNKQDLNEMELEL